MEDEKDAVVIEIYAIDTNMNEHPVGVIKIRNNGFANNSYDLPTDPNKWSMNPSTTIGIKIKVAYTMERFKVTGYP